LLCTIDHLTDQDDAQTMHPLQTVVWMVSQREVVQPVRQTTAYGWSRRIGLCHVSHRGTSTPLLVTPTTTGTHLQRDQLPASCDHARRHSRGGHSMIQIDPHGPTYAKMLKSMTCSTILLSSMPLHKSSLTNGPSRWEFGSTLSPLVRLYLPLIGLFSTKE